jgi:L-threonylcarbamoyladenylate synthase
MEKTLEAVKVLKKGGVVAYPGDTYYALGANIYDDQAIAKVIQKKGLSAGMRPIPIAVASISQLEDIAQLGSDHRAVIEKLWPGPFLFLLPKRSSVSSLLSGPSNLIGAIYFHNNMVSRLIERAGFPITATSANLTGAKEAHHPDRIEVEYDFLLKGVCPFGGMELTVVDLFNRQIVQPGIWADRAEKLLF